MADQIDTININNSSGGSNKIGLNASRYVNKLNYIDLTRRRFKLDQIFASVIDKLPDLCMPTSMRLSGEDDYFDETKKLKLIPFRKQEVFDRCISPINNSNNNDQSDSRSSKDEPGRCDNSKSAKPRPFADPMPECMLIDDNRDNLREIIVSSLDIEWKMLTPIRAENEYEDEYFDKLIYLHRCRYKTRLESGYFRSNKRGLSVFRHTRHGISLQHSMLLDNYIQHNKYGHSTRPDPSVGVKLKRKFRSKRPNKSAGTGNYGPIRMTVPTLTLTNNDEQLSTSEPLVPSRIEEDDDEDEDELNNEYTYESFSRYTRRTSSQTALKNQSVDTVANDELQSRQHGVANNGMGLMRGDNLLEDQVEDIMNHLMIDTSL